MSWARHCVIRLGWMSNCWAKSDSVRSPLIASKATRAFKAGLWFRLGRLVMVSPHCRHHAGLARIIHSSPLSSSPEPPLFATLNQTSDQLGIP